MGEFIETEEAIKQMENIMDLLLDLRGANITQIKKYKEVYRISKKDGYLTYEIGEAIELLITKLDIMYDALESIEQYYGTVLETFKELQEEISKYAITRCDNCKVYLRGKNGKKG